MRITYDQASGHEHWPSAGLTLTTLLVFEGITVEVEDRARNTVNADHLLRMLAGRLVVVGYTPRGTVRHIFSMRKANDREQTRLAPYFGV